MTVPACGFNMNFDQEHSVMKPHLPRSSSSSEVPPAPPTRGLQHDASRNKSDKSWNTSLFVVGDRGSRSSSSSSSRTMMTEPLSQPNNEVPKRSSLKSSTKWQPPSLFIPGEASHKPLASPTPSFIGPTPSLVVPPESEIDRILHASSKNSKLSRSMNDLSPSDSKLGSTRKKVSKSFTSVNIEEATQAKQPSPQKRQPMERSSARVGWNENVFVVSSDDPPPNRTIERRIPTSSSLSASSSVWSSLSPSSSPQTPSSRKTTLIADKDTRDTRWNWSQLRVRSIFSSYRAMISKHDDLLPDTDELNAFEDRETAANAEFSKVRDAMLEDNELTEREVAAFFEGFTLFNVKIRSLQSQLESVKAVSRDASQRELMRSFRSPGQSRLFPSSQPTIGSFAKALPRSTSGLRSEMLKATKAQSAGQSPRNSFMGTSLRALSIKKIQNDHVNNEEVQRLLKELEEADKKQKKLEKQLQQAGVSIAEDIPYEEAKGHVGRIARRMQEIGSSDVKHPDKAEQSRLREEYFKLEQEMEKYNTALMLTDEYIEEQEELEQKWEDDNAPDNLEALKKLRRHMPVDVKSMSEAQLSSDPTPNGKVLPQSIARRFKRTNVLQLLRLNPDDIVRMHPSTLENLRVTGMTLTERRAIYAHLKDIGPRWKSMQAEKMTERKWTWFKVMKQNFKENLDPYLFHVQQYGPPGNHPYATRDNPNQGCPMIGKQCPLKADKLVDYDTDYGYPEDAVYEVSSVRKADAEDPGAKAQREALELARGKRANERVETLKKHYKGKVSQVSLANGSCEAMDETIDRIDALQTKWIQDRAASDGGPVPDDVQRKELSAFSDALNEIKLAVLPFADRSGMQLTGKKDANADQPDIRSPIELGLCEEVYDAAEDIFKGIEERMKEMGSKDGRLKSTIDQLRDLLVELHERNLSTLKELGCPRPEPSHKRKSREELLKEAKRNLAPLATDVEESYASPATPTGGRGDLMAAIGGRGGGGGRGSLMSAIAGRGRGGGDAGGRGGLMSAIAGRGRGGDAGGRGDLMSAIAGRGRGGDTGGRGDLMSAIAGRGRGGGRGGDTGGRGDLMSAIAGRGRSVDTGGRGDLMSAIAGRGRGGDASGRGDLMSAIAGRGRGGDAGGRGDLMSAIAGRGRGGDAGGRGDLMSAIAARAAARNQADNSEERRDSGERGDLLTAIATRGAGSNGDEGRVVGERIGSQSAILSKGSQGDGNGERRDTGHEQSAVESHSVSSDGRQEELQSDTGDDSDKKTARMVQIAAQGQSHGDDNTKVELFAAIAARGRIE